MFRLTEPLDPHRAIAVPPWALFRHSFPALSPLYLLFSLPQMPVFLSAGWVLSLPPAPLGKPLDSSLQDCLFIPGHSASCQILPYAGLPLLGPMFPQTNLSALSALSALSSGSWRHVVRSGTGLGDWCSHLALGTLPPYSHCGDGPPSSRSQVVRPHGPCFPQGMRTLTATQWP